MALSVLWYPLPKIIVYSALLSMEALILPAHDDQSPSIRLASIITLAICCASGTNPQTSQKATVAFSRSLTVSPSGRIYPLATTTSTEAEVNVSKRW